MKSLSLKPGRRSIAGLAFVVLLVVLLGLDLRAHGLAWNLFWSLTGEEQPLPQLRGMVEWAGNFLRAQPNLAPDVPVNHAGVNPYGINTFLQQEVEIAKREKILQMVSEAGFTMIRQQFPWADIEVDGRGQFTDSRNDLNGDGTVDTVDAWAKYDNIVDLADQYHVAIQARLDSPPVWSRANPDAGSFAPPDDYDDFVNFVSAVAERYEGRIHYYQIWNEPNANGEWGNQPVNPEQYTDLLCRSYQALKAIDPDIVVIAAALSPTVSLTSDNLSDFIYLQRMYDAGAGACFDVMAAQGYGFYSGPTDHRLRPLTLNFGRIQYVRDLMVVNGDAGKSLWISEAAWNAQPEDPAVVTSLYGAYGIVTQEQAARFMPLAYQRAQQDWPWLGNIAYWFFKRPADYEINQAFYYFRMAEPDFTTLPVYDSMKQFITTQQPVLYPGVHQAEDWRLYSNNKKDVEDVAGAEFGKAVMMDSDTGTGTCVFGTDMRVRWRPIETAESESNQWMETLIHLGSIAYFHPIEVGHDTLTAWADNCRRGIINVGDTGSSIYLDSITVVDRTYENIFPYVAAVITLVGMTLFVVISAWWERRKG